MQKVIPELASLADSRGRLIMCLLAAACLGWMAPNAVMSETPRTDSGIFIAVAEHIKAGRVLYSQVWDHKPPMIHLLNRLAIASGEGGIMAVRRMERLFGCAMSVLFFLIVLVVFNRKGLALIASAVFLSLFYYSGVFEGGNLAEEYGALFFLGVVICSLKRLLERWPRTMASLCGIFTALAALTKEPYLLCCAPWVLYSWIMAAHDRRKLVGIMAYQAVGLSLLMLSFVLYFSLHGALLDWIKVFAYNMAYSGMTESTLQQTASGTVVTAACLVITRSYILFGIGVLGAVGVFDRSYQKRTGYITWAVSLSLLSGLVAAGMPSRFFGHYFMMIVPMWAFLLACGGDYLLKIMGTVVSRVKNWHQERQKNARLLGWSAGIVAVCLVLFIVVPPVRAAAVRVVGHEIAFLRATGISFSPEGGYEPEMKLQSVLPCEILRDEGIWAQRRYCHYYAETGSLSPTPYIYASDHLFIDTPMETREERMAIFRDGLERRPPSILVFKQYCEALPPDYALLNSYVRITRPDVAEYVLVRKDLLEFIQKGDGSD